MTKNYKKLNLTKLYNINKNAKKITKKLPTLHRIKKLQETEAYITIKRHKESFPNNIPCRLINPSKCGVGKVLIITFRKKLLQSMERHVGD